MLVPGKNGFILIIGSLLALSTVVGEDDWCRSLYDVRWVLREVLDAVRVNP